jgi:hypothetical protein
MEEIKKLVGRKRIKPIDIEKRIGVNNPLAGIDFKIVVRSLPTGTWDKDKETGILTLHEQELEQCDFVKVYTNPEHRKIVCGLSDSAKRLFLWIVYEVEAGKDWVWINKKEFMKEVGITSINTYKKAMSELVRYGFIQLSLVGDVFWINPRLFFAGSRVNKYPNNVVEYEPKKKDDAA